MGAKIKAKHTPGLWEVEENGFHVSTKTEGVATVHGKDKPTRDANARLIAAAPDLLDAAHDLIERLEGNDDKRSIAIGINFLRAVIAKAERR